LETDKLDGLVYLLHDVVLDIHYRYRGFAGPTQSGASFSGGIASGRLRLIEPADDEDAFLLRVFDCRPDAGWAPWMLFLLDPPMVYSFEAAQPRRLPQGAEILPGPAGGVWVSVPEQDISDLLAGFTVVRDALPRKPRETQTGPG